MRGYICSIGSIIASIFIILKTKLKDIYIYLKNNMSSSFPIHSPTTHPSSKNLKALVEMLHDLVDTQKIPHSIIMVGKENKLVLCDAYGHQSIEEKTNVICNEGKGKDTINRTFSMTKPILAFTTMVLHEKKILNIDFPITRYMMNNEPYKLDNLKLRPLFGSPEVMQKSFDELPSPAREITIRHLLMHVSGIYPDIEAIYSYITTRMDEEKVTDPQNVLEMFALLTCKFFYYLYIYILDLIFIIIFTHIFLTLYIHI